MKILFCSSEVVPFAKTGGLADVAGTLPPELAKLGVEIKVVLPKYKCIDTEKFKLEKLDAETSVAKLSDSVDVYFIESQKYFARDGLYQDKGEDYPDNLERFTYYCTQTLKLLKKIDFKPDLIHCNDWQTALIPVYLKTIYKKDPFYKDIKTVFTIHNLGYQGLFTEEEFPQTGLDESVFSVDGLEFYGKTNLLKGGLLFSDKITTVSQTYAQEIQTKEFGCGLEGILQNRKTDLLGILNGINYEEWNPKTNKHLNTHYNDENLDGKYAIKAELQKNKNLPIEKDVPLLGMITRLADQKGLDIFAEVIDRICQLPLQFILLGTGDPKYHEIFAQVQKKYKNTSINLTFDAALAYKIYAASDMFVMPSYYEPCGLGQLISFSFGTIPLVRKTGGLADTVVDYNLKTGDGNGFVFSGYKSKDLLQTIERALGVYKDSAVWKNLVVKSMQEDFSWGQSAKKYFKLYEEVTKQKVVV
ncbi:MAG: glycogen synthase GlgA [PVC group bacterium]|nr:glycogen synthase GlgA [PVC group bacterium]